MKRVSIAERPQWKTRVEALGLDFHTTESKYYWVEDAAYVFEPREIDEIQAATLELHRLCMEAVEFVIQKNRFKQMAIPESAIPLITASWEENDPTLYGRFDLSLAPGEPPKMLEYNADTPTALLESSVIQWHWIEEQTAVLGQGADQFNFIHEQLIATFKDYREYFMKPGERFHFACVTESSEDLNTVEYLRDCARQAEIPSRFIYLEDIGWDGGKFVDLEMDPILHLFKLHPWETILREPFAPHFLKKGLRMTEPPWKMVLSNKAILPILWEMFEGHPNLLPTYFEPGPLGRKYVKKPIFSREGANITIVDEEQTVASEGIYGEEGHIYQKFSPLPRFDGNYAMVGSWIVADEACGMCVRESNGLITDNLSRFVPHYFMTKSEAPSGGLFSKLTERLKAGIQWKA